MARATPVNPLSLHDWNFDNVPDNELIGCCYWEYARESAFIRDTLKDYREHWYCPGGKFNEWVLKNDRRLEQIQSIGQAADVFVRGCVFKPGTVWQSEHPKKPGYRHPQAPPLSGAFPGAWQSLPEVERTCRARIRSDVEQLQIVPVKLAHWGWAKEISRECQRTFDDQHEQRMIWERKYLRRDEQGNFHMAKGAPPPPDFEPVRPRTRWGLGETLMLDIAWEHFTNDEIASYFRHWVKKARPKECPVPDGKGRNKARDWRANLMRLAVLRLLSHFTAAEFVDPRRNALPAVWDTKQFAGRKWGDVTKWHDARREANHLFRKLFPFLPKGELPLSWQRVTRSK